MPGFIHLNYQSIGKEMDPAQALTHTQELSLKEQEGCFQYSCKNARSICIYGSRGKDAQICFQRYRYHNCNL